jgi:hypothetical protein
MILLARAYHFCWLLFFVNTGARKSVGASAKMSKSLVGVHARQTQISTLLMVFMVWVWTESHRDVISRKLLSPSAPMFTHKIMKTRSNSPSPLYSRLLSDAAQTNFINIDDEIGTVCSGCVPFARPPDVCSLAYSLLHVAGPRIR